MVRQDAKRSFGLRESDENESSVFSGNYPRQAALKAARQLTPASSEADADQQELRLRERGTDKLHIYDAWAWEEDAPEDGPSGSRAPLPKPTSQNSVSHTSTNNTGFWPPYPAPYLTDLRTGWGRGLLLLTFFFPQRGGERTHESRHAVQTSY